MVGFKEIKYLIVVYTVLKTYTVIEKLFTMIEKPFTVIEKPFTVITVEIFKHYPGNSKMIHSFPHFAVHMHHKKSYFNPALLYH